MADPISPLPANEPNGRVRAGVVGLGMMGLGIARSIDAAGFLTAVHDRRDAATVGAPELAPVWRDSPAEVAGAAEIVLVVVVDAAQVEQVLFGPSGIAEAPRPELVVGICSTIDAAELAQLARRAASAGVRVIDVGIAGGPDAAASGGLVTLVGAAPAAFDVARPVLDAMSVRVVHAGDVGAGMQLKLVKNALSFLTMCAVHEALLLGEELGFDHRLVQEVVEKTNTVDHFFWFPMSRPTARLLASTVDAEQLAAAEHFAAIAEKDLDAAIASADRIGMAHPVLDVARRQVRRSFLLPDEPTPSVDPADP